MTADTERIDSALLRIAGQRGQDANLLHALLLPATDGSLPALGEAQRRLARIVAEALDAPPAGSALVTLTQAATGTGKSVALLAPVMALAALQKRQGVRAERAALSTFTNHLAGQLLDDDAPRIGRALESLGLPAVSVATRAGQRQFIDPERVERALDRPGLHREGPDRRALETLGVYDTFTEAEDHGVFVPQGFAADGLCLTLRSSAAAAAAFSRCRRAANAADVLLTNHALVLTDCRYRGGVLGIGGTVGTVLFDEADALPLSSTWRGSARHGLNSSTVVPMRPSLTHKVHNNQKLEGVPFSLALFVLFHRRTGCFPRGWGPVWGAECVAKRRKLLNAAFVEKRLPAGKYYDENGLILRVRASGNKYWLQRYTFRGRRPTIGLGRYPVLTLAQARATALDNLRTVHAGEDPLAKRRTDEVPTFAEAARCVLEERRPHWTNARQPGNWIRSLEAYAFPCFGNRPVSAIEPRDVIDALLRIWHTKRGTAVKVRSRIGVVLQWAVARGYRSDNAAGDVISGALSRDGRPKRHQPAVPHSEVARVLALVFQSRALSVTKLSFEFLVLTAARSGEVRGALWSEIDLDDRSWTVPAERMKARAGHRVPLSTRALRVLNKAAEFGVCQGLVFPSKKNRELSVATHSRLLRDLGVKAVPHGFRSSFRDWCGETGVSRELTEACLSHTVGSAVEAAYARSDLFERRRAVMEDWARYLDQSASALPEGRLPRSRRCRASSARPNRDRKSKAIRGGEG